MLSDFEIFETLGTGTFGRVRLVRCITEDKYYAMKVVKKIYVLQMDQLDHMKAEIRLLRILDHPFIVVLQAHFQDELRLYLLMELVIGGELYALLRNAGKFKTDRAKFYAAEVVLVFEYPLAAPKSSSARHPNPPRNIRAPAAAPPRPASADDLRSEEDENLGRYLHGMHVAYRSLKPENVLIDETGNVKLIDFGFAKVVKERTFTPCGTPECEPRGSVLHGTGSSPRRRRDLPVCPRRSRGGAATRLRGTATSSPRPRRDPPSEHGHAAAAHRDAPAATPPRDGAGTP